MKTSFRKNQVKHGGDPEDPDFEGVPPSHGQEDDDGLTPRIECAASDEKSPHPPIPSSPSNRKRVALTAAAALFIAAVIAVAIGVPLALRGRSSPAAATTPPKLSAAKAAGVTAPSCSGNGDCPDNADCLVTAADGGGGEPRCFCRDGFVLSSDDIDGASYKCLKEGEAFQFQPSEQSAGCLGGGDGECSENAECVDLPEGGQGCRCNEGFKGDGATACEDLDECLGEGDGNDCSENAVCGNAPGSFDCVCRPGHFGDPRGSACKPMGLAISSPSYGSFSEELAIEVEGRVVVEPLEDVKVTVNEIPVDIGHDGSFAITVPLDQDKIFNGVRVELMHSPTGFKLRDRVVVIAAQSAPLGGTVRQSAAIRIAKGSFETLEKIANDDLGGSDLSDLIPRGTKLIDGKCFKDSFFGCLIRGDVKVRNTRVNGMELKVDPQEITVTLKGMKVDLKADTNSIDCDIEITANSASATASYSLDPDPSDRTNMRVSQLENIRIDFSGFDKDFDCSFSLGSVVQSVVGDVKGKVRDGLKKFLQGDVVTGEIKDVLAQLEITEPIFAGMGASSSTPLFDVTQDREGITLAMDTVLTTLDPNPSSPKLAKTVSIPQQFPFAQLSSSSPLTPRGRPYDVAFALSDSVLNQIMAVQVEAGEFDLEVAEIPFGTGDPTPITASLLSLLVSPKFAELTSVQGLRLRISPTLAPVLAGNAGPNGELATVLLSHLLLDVVSEDGLHVRMAVDTTMLLDFEADEGTGRVMPLFKSPKDASPRMTLLDNPLNIDEVEIRDKMVPLIPELVSLLGGSIPSFALPNFFGLTLSVAEISRVGDFVGIFVNRSG